MCFGMKAFAETGVRAHIGLNWRKKERGHHRSMRDQNVPSFGTAGDVDLSRTYADKIKPPVIRTVFVILGRISSLRIP